MLVCMLATRTLNRTHAGMESVMRIQPIVRRAVVGRCAIGLRRGGSKGYGCLILSKGEIMDDKILSYLIN